MKYKQNELKYRNHMQKY